MKLKKADREIVREAEYYAVQFEDGTYFTRNGLRYNERTTENIESATLYVFDWEIPKDIYLEQYLYGKDLSYMVVKVRVKTTFEVISS